jgi:hypothetical protein
MQMLFIQKPFFFQKRNHVQQPLQPISAGLRYRHLDKNKNKSLRCSTHGIGLAPYSSPQQVSSNEMEIITMHSLHVQPLTHPTPTQTRHQFLDFHTNNTLGL